MSTTTPKAPGEVQDSSGFGNDDFDQGIMNAKFGYPILELWRLREPLTVAQLKERFGIALSQGWRYATQQLVDETPLQEMEKLF